MLPWLAVTLAAAALAQAPVKSVADRVRIDVIAADERGRSVEDLKPGDFELTEDGVPQALDEVRFVDAGRGTEAAPIETIQSASDERRAADGAQLLAIYLDDYHVSSGVSTTRVRESLARFVDTLRPSDLVVIMRPLDSLLTIRMTRDRSALHQIINEFEGRQGDYSPRTPYEQNFMAANPSRVEQARAQMTISALNALALHLGRLSESRKTLVLVGEGLPPIERRREYSPLPTLETVIRSANKSNVSIYTVDPRSAAGDEAGANRNADAARNADAPRLLASETDGRVIAGASDLATSLRDVTADARAYYLLVYHTSKKQDGAFHDVQVRVNRSNVRIRARKGFWAALPEEALHARMAAGEIAPPAISPVEPARHISPLIRPWFGSSRGANGKTRVTFVWEPAARALGDRTRQSSASRVVFKALSADGSSLFDAEVLPTGPSRIEAADGSPAAVSFDAPPGPLRLRMSIEDAAARVIDADVRDITVRDFSVPVALGSAEVMRARTARDMRSLKDDPRAVPVSSREFSRTEQLLVRFRAYAPAGVPRSVSVRLLSRLGQPMRDLAIAPTAIEDQYQLEVPLAGLAAADYLVEFTIVSSAGEAKDLLGFRVTN